MKTFLLLTTLLLFFEVSIIAQPIFTNLHQDSSQTINLGGNLVLKSYDGNYITIGDRKQYVNFIHGSTNSIYINKTSPNGQVLWEKEYYISDVGHHMNAYEDSISGEIVVIGAGFDGNLSYPHSDPMIIRLDSLGNLLTSGSVNLSYMSHSYHTSNAIKSGPNQYTYLTRDREVVGPFINNFSYYNTIITLDGNKNVLQFNSFPQTQVGGLVQTNDNGFLFGEVRNNTIYLNKTNSFLNLEWDVQLVNTPSSNPIEIYPISDGNFIMLCSKYHYPGTPWARTDLHKFTPNGTLLWSKTHANIEATQLLERADGSFYLACGIHDTTSNDVNIGVCVLDSLGNITTSKVYPSPNRDLVGGLIENDCEGFVLVGQIDYTNLDTTIGPGKCIIISDTLSMITNPCITTTTPKMIPEPLSAIYPNPFVDVVHVEMTATEGQLYSFKLYNSHGQIVFSTAFSETINTLHINEQLPSGFYYYEIASEGQSYDTGKLFKLK